MRIIILLAFITYIKSSYYSECKKPPEGRFGYLTSAECRKHNPKDGHCCALSYLKRNGSHKKKSKYMECIGITEEGYNNIINVKDDLEENLDSVSIKCHQKY